MSKTENAIQTIEQQSKADLLSIHANMDILIKSAEHITIAVDDKESYVQAVELKKTIKQTHVAIEKKRKELKAPIIEAGKSLDAFAKSIYVPLKDAESILKEKMLPYEQEQEKIQEQERIAKEKEQQEKDALNEKLMHLNSVLPDINSCKNKSEIQEIENKLAEINPKDFGERSDEAGFILTNLKTTCMMIKKSLPEKIEEPIVIHDGMKYNPENPEATVELTNNTDKPQTSLAFGLEKNIDSEEVIIHVQKEKLDINITYPVNLPALKKEIGAINKQINILQEKKMFLEKRYDELNK